MIYISSTNIKRDSICDSIDALMAEGFDHIELSGGSSYQNDLEQTLAKYHQQGLTFRLHNYYPPPKKHFVVNLCGRGNIVDKSQELIITALKLSNKLESRVFGFHAGFRVQPRPEDLGKSFSNPNLMPYEESIDSFVTNFQMLSSTSAETRVELFLENNVVTSSNLRFYSGENPFLLTNYSELLELKEKIDFNLLLDIGHLKVSCKTLKLNFEEQLESMLKSSKYIHISDNSGDADENMGLTEKSDMYSCLKNFSSLLKNKTFTLEVYSGVPSIKETHRLLSQII